MPTPLGYLLLGSQGQVLQTLGALPNPTWSAPVQPSTTIEDADEADSEDILLRRDGHTLVRIDLDALTYCGSTDLALAAWAGD